MTFRNRYEKIVQNLLERSLTKADGIPESTIIKFEIENNFNLPYALREYYSLLGNLDSINRANDRLLRFDEISIEANKLVFMEENQRVCFWGIDLEDFKNNNPPIYQWDSMYNSVGIFNIEEWNLYISKCSNFLITMFYLQAASGGLFYGGMANINEAQFKIIETEWDFIIESQGMKVYGGLGTSICIYGFSDSLELTIGCNNENAFAIIEEKLELDWDYIYE